MFSRLVSSIARGSLAGSGRASKLTFAAGTSGAIGGLIGSAIWVAGVDRVALAEEKGGLGGFSPGGVMAEVKDETGKGESMGTEADDGKKVIAGDQKDEFGNDLNRMNPGKFDTISKTANEVLNPEITDGARISLQQPLFAPMSNDGQPAKYLGLNHTLWMGTSFFGPEKKFYEMQTALQCGKFVLIGSLDSMYRVNGRAIALLGKGLIGRLQFMMSPNPRMPDNFALKGEYRGSDYTTTAELSSDSIGATYLQTINSQWAMGAQYLFSPASFMSPLILCARYRQGGNTAVAQVAHVQDRLNLTVHYSRKFDKHYTLATMVQLMPQKMASSAGIKYDFCNESRARYYATFDTDLTCSTHYSEEVIPQFRMGFCGQIQHQKSEYQFGMTFAMGE